MYMTIRNRDLNDVYELPERCNCCITELREAATNSRGVLEVKRRKNIVLLQFHRDISLHYPNGKSLVEDLIPELIKMGAYFGIDFSLAYEEELTIFKINLEKNPNFKRWGEKSEPVDAGWLYQICSTIRGFFQEDN